MTKEESKLENLKEEYFKLQKKYDLPSFEDLNKDFQIEKISESETDFLIREVRKMIADRIVGYLRFTETLINPTNAPMFILSAIKNLEMKDKNKLSEIYKKLAKMEIKFVKLDLEFSEQEEVNFVKEAFDLWNVVKKEFIDILSSIEHNWDNKAESGKRDYFG